MSERRWRGNGGHPPPETLLLFIENELPSGEAVAVSSHLDDCWQCRARRDLIEQGIFRFMLFHETVSVPPPPTAGAQRLRSRLQEESEKAERGFWTVNWWHPVSRWLKRSVPASSIYASAAAAAAVICLVAISVTTSQRVEAATFLDRVRRSAETARLEERGKLVCQRVRIRHGNHVEERELYRGAVKTDTPPLEPELRRAFDLAGVNWQDPLNVDNFAAWRDSVSGKRDQVSEEDDEVTLKTTVTGASPVREADFVVARSNWRPVSRYVAFRDRESLEITAISYEIHDAAPVQRRTAALDAGVPQAPREPDWSARLQDSELRLREALHGVGADTIEGPEIWARDRKVYYRVFPETEERMAAIRRATVGIPLVAEAPPQEIGAVEPAPQHPETDLAPASEGTASYATTPPLAKALRERFGGLGGANTYLDEVGDLYTRLLAETAALNRLGDRYSANETAKLPASEQRRVARIADDHITAIRQLAAQYLDGIGTVLDSLGTGKFPSQGTPETATSGPKPDWRQAATLVAADLLALHKAFTRLFVQEQVEQPVELDATELLGKAAAARKAIVRDLQVFPTRD